MRVNVVVPNGTKDLPENRTVRYFKSKLSVDIPTGINIVSPMGDCTKVQNHQKPKCRMIFKSTRHRVNLVELLKLKGFKALSIHNFN